MPQFTKVMKVGPLRSILRVGVFTLFAVFAFCGSGYSQQVAVAELRPEMEPAAPSPAPAVGFTQPTTLPKLPTRHSFWDRENTALFAANAAFASADFVVTRDNLRSGGQELNPVTRIFSGSTAGLAANFAGETAGVIGLSYFFHRTGQHRLERAVSMLNLSSSAAAVSFGLAHR
jgi:hypothetical protein